MKCPDCGHRNLAGAEFCEHCSTPFSHAPASLGGRGLAERLSGGTMSDAKPRRALVLEPGATVADAVRRMRRAKTGSALVVRGGRPEGVLTEHGLIQKVVSLRDPSKTAVSEVMETEPVCLNAEDPVAYAFHQISLGGYRHLAVRLADGSFGTVSAQELVEYLAEE